MDYQDANAIGSRDHTLRTSVPGFSKMDTQTQFSWVGLSFASLTWRCDDFRVAFKDPGMFRSQERV